MPSLRSTACLTLSAIALTALVACSTEKPTLSPTFDDPVPADEFISALTSRVDRYEQAHSDNSDWRFTVIERSGPPDNPDIQERTTMYLGDSQVTVRRAWNQDPTVDRVTAITVCASAVTDCVTAERSPEGSWNDITWQPDPVLGRMKTVPKLLEFAKSYSVNIANDLAEPRKPATIDARTTVDTGDDFATFDAERISDGDEYPIRDSVWMSFNDGDDSVTVSILGGPAAEGAERVRDDEWNINPIAGTQGLPPTPVANTAVTEEQIATYAEIAPRF